MLIRTDHKYSLNGKVVEIVAESLFEKSYDVKHSDGHIEYGVNPDDLKILCSKCGCEC